MKQFTATWNGTKSQARAMVEAWKVEQAEKQRKRKMALWFSRGSSLQNAWEKVTANF